MDDKLESLLNKDQALTNQELVSIVRQLVLHLDEVDLKCLIEAHISKQETFTHDQAVYRINIIRSQANKVLPKGLQLTRFYFNSLVLPEQQQILIRDIDLPDDFDSDAEFIDTIGQDLYKKLLHYATHGLLSFKLDERPLRRYTFFQWVQNNLELSPYEQDDLYLLLLKQVWNFQFLNAADTLQKIKISYPDNPETNSIQVGLKIFIELYRTFTRNEELKEKFVDRKEFQIKFESDHNNKTEEKEFNNTVNEIKQQLLFATQYFSVVKPAFKNPCFQAIALFLSNREDNFLKDHHEPTMALSKLSIVDRFLFARRFYRPDDLDSLKKKLTDQHILQTDLEYIILFGIRKQSQIILQNYLDATNDLQTVATISVLLKIFLQQSKIGSKDAKTGAYSKFIREYEGLLVAMDSGISKHKFDKKCITIEVERKKKTMNKTFKFNCISCKSSQCLLSISKRIAADARQTQPRMKGNNLFAKDSRNQVRNCLDCMYLLPRCCVCLFPVTVYNGYAEQAKRGSLTKARNGGESLSNALVWCPKCFHGGHFSHIMLWMQLGQKRCPVASCKCKCER